ncbi:MAG: 1-deoxy-D-xylulose-5-phosphate synthase, partial [Lachnospiraceae bacterium]|nr:1-deoxy-D-xylulose-5-phosphate synthase [Lachnospiraceae bacterium]
GMFFEKLDIKYVGPIDGHDIKQLKNVLITARNTNTPVLIHVKTKKGKGYKPAEDNPTLYHGVGPFDMKTGEIIKTSTKKSYTRVFSDKLIELATKNEKIVAITAAMADGTGLTTFAEKYPDRFFDVGICEQHAVTCAAGMAVGGLIPVVCVYSSFLQRAFDQIIHDVCLQNQHVVFCIDRAGLVGADGETHQGIFDISYLRLIPSITILAPKNDIEFESMLEFAINEIKGPVAIRYPRGIAYNELHEYNEKMSYGKAEILSKDENDKNSKIVFYALGSMVSTAIHLKSKLKNKNIESVVVNARFAKPIDFDTIDKFLEKNSIYKSIDEFICLEEGVANGGIGQEIESYIHS